MQKDRRDKEGNSDGSVMTASVPDVAGAEENMLRLIAASYGAST